MSARLILKPAKWFSAFPAGGFSYDNLISADGKYYGGGGLPAWGNTMERMDLKTGQWINANTGNHMATAKRGGFDPDDNPWFGGGDGALIELNSKTGLIQEWVPPMAPSPLTDFYEAQPDKNGEVWAGVLHGRQMVRLNPKNRSLDGLPDAGTVHLRPPDVHRQFHAPGNRMVCRLQRVPGSRAAPRIRPFRVGSVFRWASGLISGCPHLRVGAQGHFSFRNSSLAAPVSFVVASIS